MAETTIKLNLGPLHHLQRGIQSGGSGPIDAFRKRMAVRYLTQLRRDFATASSGGGDWPPLKASTKRRRRGARRSSRGPRTFSILRNTGTLFNALLVGGLGNVIRPIRNGVRVGLGGGASHPGAPMTIGRLARIHDQGAGNNPQRRIIREPNARTRAAILADARYAFGRLTSEAKRKR